MYRCGECARPMGAMLDAKGKPEMFKCPRTGNATYTIPKEPIRRKPIKIQKQFLPEDYSMRATKHRVEDGS